MMDLLKSFVMIIDYCVRQNDTGIEVQLDLDEKLFSPFITLLNRKFD